MIGSICLYDVVWNQVDGEPFLEDQEYFSLKIFEDLDLNKGLIFEASIVLGYASFKP